ncbi:hypothetical protein ACFQV4_16820 [Streptomyces thermocarboxydus]
MHAALPYLWPSVTRVTALDEGPLGSGLHVGEGVLTAGGGRAAAPCLTSQMQSCRDTLADMGATAFYRDLHPASHYWPLQLVATGILLAVAKPADVRGLPCAAPYDRDGARLTRPRTGGRARGARPLLS